MADMQFLRIFAKIDVIHIDICILRGKCSCIFIYSLNMAAIAMPVKVGGEAYRIMYIEIFLYS